MPIAIARISAVLMLAPIGAAGCKLDSLHADAWEVREEFEFVFCDCVADTPQEFDGCLASFGGLHVPDTREFRRECQAELDDQRKYRKAAKAYYECVVEQYETGLACLEENVCEFGGTCDVHRAALQCGVTEETTDFREAAEACAYERALQAAQER